MSDTAADNTASDADKAKWLDKIRKILATAENAATSEATRAILLGKAADLAAKFGIDQAMLAATLSGTARQKVAERSITVPAPFSYPKLRLLSKMADVMGVEVWIISSRDDRMNDYPIHAGFAGFDSDMTRLEVLYTSLLVQSAYAMAAQFVPAWETRADFLGAFYDGYTAAIVKRLRDAEDRARGVYDGAHTGPGTALVLASRADEVARFVQQTYPDMGFTRGPKAPRSTGRQAGYAEGKRANLGGPTIGSGGAAGRSIR